MLYDDDDKITMIDRFLTGVIIVCMIVGLCVFLSSCKSVRVVEVERVHNDTVYQYKSVVDTCWQYKSIVDTTYVKDSIVLELRNDTIWQKEWHTKYKEVNKTDTLYKYAERIDTVYKSSVDTIPSIVEVDKPVKYTPWYWKILGCIGALTILTGVITLWLLFRKRHE